MESGTWFLGGTSSNRKERLSLTCCCDDSRRWRFSGGNRHLCAGSLCAEGEAPKAPAVAEGCLCCCRGNRRIGTNAAELPGSALGGREAAVDFIPVHDIPPCGQILRTAVLVLQIIGMLPDVVAEDGEQALREGRILVGGGDDLELAAGENHPTPTGAELLGGGFVEGLLERLEIAEVGGDLIGDGASGLAADAGG